MLRTSKSGGLWSYCRMASPHSLFLRKDLRPALISFFGVFAMVGILPFALWRFSQGQTLAGVLDLIIVVSLVGPVWVAKRYQKIEAASRFLVVLATVACIVMAPVNGRVIIYWAFPVLVANLLMAGRAFGLTANLCLIVGLLIPTGLHADAAERTTFAITASLVSIYAYVFAMMTSRQRDALESLATFDFLTGAGNRRMMEVELAEKFAHAVKHMLQYAVVVLDLDHFKLVNDSCGHEAGDKVLKQLVGLIHEVMRGDDRLYRMGGEEFVIFLPHTGHAGLAAFLDRLQDYLRPRLSGPGGPVTVSIGAAVADYGDEAWSDWLARADQAMYQAKQSGRDRFCIAAASYESPSFENSPSTSASSPGMACSSENQAPRSIRRQRSLQNGRQRDSGDHATGLPQLGQETSCIAGLSNRSGRRRRFR